MNTRLSNDSQFGWVITRWKYTWQIYHIYQAPNSPTIEASICGLCNGISFFQAPVILAILSAGIQQPRELKILLDDYCNNQGFEMDLATDDFKVGGALRTLEWRKKTQTIIVFQSSPVMCKHEERWLYCRRCLVDRSTGRFIQHVLEGVFFLFLLVGVVW